MELKDGAVEVEERDPLDKTTENKADVVNQLSEASFDSKKGNNNLSTKSTFDLEIKI